MSFLVQTLTTKQEVNKIIRDTLDKVLVLRFGRASDVICLQLDDILAKSSRELSKFAVVALVDIDSVELHTYVRYFDIVLIPSTVFFFNAHHMKMDSGTPDHTKWVGSFQCKQDFIDVVEAIYRGAMKVYSQMTSRMWRMYADYLFYKKEKTVLWDMIEPYRRPKSFTPLVVIYVAAFYTGVIGSALTEQIYKEKYWKDHPGEAVPLMRPKFYWGPWRIYNGDVLPPNK